MELEQIRQLIATEVERQMHQVVATVGRLDKTMRSLYANGSGGPPGYLEMARAEDKERLTELLQKIDKIDGRMDSFDDFVTRHEVEKEKDEKAAKESERKFKRYIALCMAILALLTILVGLWEHRGEIGRSLMSSPVSKVYAPQDAGIPQNR